MNPFSGISTFFLPKNPFSKKDFEKLNIFLKIILKISLFKFLWNHPINPEKFQMNLYSTLEISQKTLIGLDSEELLEGELKIFLKILENF